MTAPGTDAENIAHLASCPGCEHCTYLLEFYEACDICGSWGHKSTMESDGHTVACHSCARPLTAEQIASLL